MLADMSPMRDGFECAMLLLPEAGIIIEAARLSSGAESSVALHRAESLSSHFVA